MKKNLMNFTLILTILFFNISVALAETVIYNIQSGIYHNYSCASANRCTKNCIKIDKKEAIKRGGRACKNCGG